MKRVLKAICFDDAVRFNASIFANEYSDVKAQLFAVACNDTTSGETVAQCVSAGTSTTFEYYENGGDVESVGVEMDIQWLPTPELMITGSMAWLDSEFADGYAVGNSQLRPLLGLGNLEGRQDINNNNSQFSFAGWRPAMSPEFSAGFSAAYEFELENGGMVTPSVIMKYVGDYYAFDTNIPEAKVDAHTMIDARITWAVNDNIDIEAFVLNLTNEEILTRAVVHSQIVNGLPANSIQANWNDPRTWGISFKYKFE